MQIKELDVRDWLPLIGVAVGAMLTWLTGLVGQWLAARRDEKKAIARALSELLEIRLRLLAIPKAAELLSQHFPIPPEGQTAIKIAFARLFPVDVDFAKRYGEAVSLVATWNPILGFRLRSQDQASSLLDTLRQLAVADSPAAAALFAKLETELIGHLGPHLERLIRELAWKHGWLTWWRSRHILQRPMEIPDGLLKMLKAQLPAGSQGTQESAKAPCAGP